MPSGKVYLSGSPGDALLDGMRARLTAAGYSTTVLGHDDDVRSLSPVAAGIDLWRVLGDERYEAVAALDERLPPSKPLLSLCTAAGVDEVASYAVRGERVVGFSVFGPLHDGMLAEVLPGLGTESGAVARTKTMLEGLGFATATLPPGSWAVLPRILAMIVNEAAVAVSEGVATPEDIDSAMKLGANYEEGPLALADTIGLGEVLAVLEALHAEYGEERYRPAPLLRRLVLAGYAGRAVGRGFHLY